ncbi:MAG: DinB family protein [Gemmatimonadaceae bacterium]|nr:DinB family protein [Gemmatimonadaceae bacterium]
MSKRDPLRQQLSRFTDFGDAHATADAAMAGMEHALQGKRPNGLPHSAWELLEHIRITQHDILDFCINPKYEEMKWPDDYWPKGAAPPAAGSWKKSVAAFRADRDALRAMAENTELDLFAAIPHGDGQTHLRELLLAQDHLSYHVGQLVLVRQALGAWPPAK